MDGVSLMARCLDGEVVRSQLSAHYPQAAVREVPPEDDPLRLDGDEQAWSMTLRADAPELHPPAHLPGTTTSSTQARTPLSPCWER